MDLPKRKSIRLKGYDYSQNGYYFITICTHKRQNLFGEIVGATLCGRPHETIEKWLLEMENKFFGVEICKFTIMPDHIHFILSQAGDHAGSPLQNIIGWFKTMTTNEYIKKVKANEYLPFLEKMWQRGYYEHIIRNENEYREIWEYIDTNLLKCELEEKCINEENDAE